MAPILRGFARHAWRGIVLVVGLVLIAAGLVMMVTPGPGIAAILGGLALLSTEFAWARRVLDWVRRRFAAARAEVRRRATRRSGGPAPDGGTEGAGAGGPPAAGAEVRSTGDAPAGDAPAGDARAGGAPAGRAPAGGTTRPRDGRDPQSTTS